MPQRNRISVRALLPLGLLAVAVLAVFRRKPDEWDYEVTAEEVADSETPIAPRVAGRRPAKRFAVAAAFTTLFFAGAAFTAGAGDQAVRLMEEDAAALEADQTVSPPAEDAAPVDEPAVSEAPALATTPGEATPEERPAGAPAAEASTVEPTEIAPVPASTPSAEAAFAAEPVSEPAAARAPAPVAAPVVAAIRRQPDRAEKPAVPRETTTPAPAARSMAAQAATAPAPAAPELESENGGQATVWLNRALPDPTPASARLARSFARTLQATAKRNGADWAIVLGVLRAEGKRGAAPGTRSELEALARQVAGKEAWEAALSYSSRTAFADQADALADLYRSVGIEALVSGFAKSKDRLAERLLEQEGILLYAGGREDIEAGRIDVRVLVLIGYLARRHESVTVSSLFSGHRMFARPGVVSAHMYGYAVDIAAVGGRPISGNSGPGGLTEDAVRSVLLLPSELQPRQVISLLGLGGPSFPLRDHADHIHVGF